MTPFLALNALRAKIARVTAAHANALARKDTAAMTDAVLLATALSDAERIMLTAWRNEARRRPVQHRSA